MNRFYQGDEVVTQISLAHNIQQFLLENAQRQQIY